MLLIDSSAWARLPAPGLPDARAQEVADALERGEVLACVPFLLEAGYAARSASDHATVMKTLLALPRAAIDEETERLALEAHVQLARAGHHRVPPADLLLGALADRHRLDVLHYDAHYDQIVEHTALRFESVWLAPRGSLSA